jgi:flagellar FliL protein
MKKKKFLIPLIVVLFVVVYAAYSVAMPHKKVTPKINGTVYILPKQFTLNLKGGQYATLTAALLLPPTQAIGVTSPSDPPPTGFGPLTDEAVIRAIITNDVTDQPASAQVTSAGRTKLEATILKNINSQTDTKATKIYFTDLAVQ